MDEKEKYELYKSKIKKQTKHLFIISLTAFLVNFIFSYKVLINIINFDDLYQEIISQMTETFFGGKIGVIVWIFSVIAVFLALLLLCILSFAAMVKAKKDDFQNISDLLIVGMAAFIISYAVFVIEFIIVIDIFILMCLITIFLLIPQMWEIFGPLIELLFMLIPGLIVGIIWFIKTIDIKNTLKNLDFYKNLK